MFENGFIFDGAGNHDFLLLNRSVGFHLVIDFGNVDLGIFTVRSFNPAGFFVRRFDLVMNGR
ncbi:Uncharacterised protein [Mycobacteroides abscessus subsp. abscessus]|nr:Uncharacterised protein [Mycobacteroides abscessus subsp. abscessus]